MKVKKLVLKRETIVALERNEQQHVLGGTGASCAGVSCTQPPPPMPTAGNCDLPTVGHDDGPNCVSKSDWGWCWCYGV